MGQFHEGRRPVLADGAYFHDQGLQVTILLLRLRSSSLPPWSLFIRGRQFHAKVRGPAEQAESTDTERFGKTTSPLLSAREAGPPTKAYGPTLDPAPLGR